MRLRSLFNQHQNRFNAIRRMGIDPAMDFLKSYGSHAEFLHIGVDSYRDEGNNVIRPQMFAVFQISKPEARTREILPLTEVDMMNLAETLKHHDFSFNTHKNMIKQLDRAVRDYEVCKPLVHERVPYARMLRAI